MLEQWDRKAELPAEVPIGLELVGFQPEEIISIRSPSLFEAGRELGQSTADLAHRQLDFFLRPAPDPQAVLESCERSLSTMERLAATETFRVDGINYLGRFLERFEGYRSGAALTRGQAAVLHQEPETGCQTVYIQDRIGGTIRFVHMEENGSDSSLQALNRRDPPGVHPYAYRMVETDNGRLTFFSYPGMCTGGPSMGINRSTGAFVSVDALYTQASFRRGTVWVNAVAAMMLDAGDIGTATRLVHQMQKARIRFVNGYAVHMAQLGNPPDMVSFEFAGNNAEIIQPTELPDRRVIAQSNFPRGKNGLQWDSLKVPARKKPWTDEQTALRSLMMRRRKRRLEYMGALVSLSPVEPADEMHRLRNFAANPYGDIRSGESTGMANSIVAAHAIGMLGKHHSRVEFHKLNPVPMPGKPYTILFDSTRRFARVDLSGS
jgi:hypothetical protein